MLRRLLVQECRPVLSFKCCQAFNIKPPKSSVLKHTVEFPETLDREYYRIKNEFPTFYEDILERERIRAKKEFVRRVFENPYNEKNPENHVKLKVNANLFTNK